MVKAFAGLQGRSATHGVGTPAPCRKDDTFPLFPTEELATGGVRVSITSTVRWSNV